MGPLAARTPSWTGVWLPRAAVALFALGYLLAAALYPGGTRAEPRAVGFRWLENYWCDLLDAVTYGGLPNPARPVALLATVVLCGGLAVLWWHAPRLYPEAPWRGRVVRASGVLSGALVPLVATRLHNAIISLAGALGLLAFALTTFSVHPRAGRFLRGSTALGLALTLVNYAVWLSGQGVRWLPLLQKCAFGAALVWILALSRRLSRA